MSEEFKPITLNTQEEVNSFFGKRAAQVEKKYEGYFSPENHQSALDEAIANAKQESSKELEELKEKITMFETKEKEYQTTISKYETDSVKTEIAKKYGLSEDAIEYIQGSNAEEYENSAKKLVSIFKNVPNNPPGKGNNLGEDEDGVEKAFKRMNPNIKF